MNTNTPETKESDTAKQKTGGGWMRRLVMLLRVAWEGWLEVFLFVPSFCFKNVFFIERQGGPLTYVFTLLLLPVSPFFGASCGIAQALINVDEELSQHNDKVDLTGDPRGPKTNNDVAAG